MWRSLVFLISAQVFIHACMAGLRLGAPLLALHEGQSAAAVGFLLALFAVGQMAVSIPAGKLADRYGLVLPVIYAAVFASLCVGVAAFWSLFPMLCVAAFVTGAATALAVIAIQRHGGRMARNDGELRTIFGWLALSSAIANFLGPVSVGHLIDEAGYRWAFVAMACLPWFAIGAVWKVGDLPPERVAAKSADAAKRRAWDLLQSPLFRKLLLANLLTSLCWDVHTFIVPLLATGKGLSASQTGIVLGCFALASIAVRMTLPLFASRVREWKMLLVSMALTSAIFVVYPFMPGAYEMGACSALLGLALGIVQPMVMSMLHQITPAGRHGEALGVRMLLLNASSVCMPLMFGSAGAAMGAASVFWVVGAAVGLGMRVSWLLGKEYEARATLLKFQKAAAENPPDNS